LKTYCTRPNCPQPINDFPALDGSFKIQTAQDIYCQTCGMPQILGGPYIPQKLLGKGGFGAAYLARDRYSPEFRKCVVKQFQPSNQFNENTLKKAKTLFKREAVVLAQLGKEHSQIPQLYAFFPLILEEAGEEKQFFYLVQEFIEGETLKEEVQKKGKLNEQEILEVLENMLKILQFVHEHEHEDYQLIVHRDIKPSNIMRDRAGKLYLLDFGAVKRVTGSTNPPASTGIGSVGYAAPEQMQGQQVYPCTDLYALGATCLRLITGKPIRDLSSAIKDLHNGDENQWRWRQQTRQISEELATVLKKMLQPKPKDRFESASEILTVLQRDRADRARSD